MSSPAPGTSPSALIDFRSPGKGIEPLRLAFGRPFLTLQAHSPADVIQLLSEVDRISRSGAWCVGHLKYEAAAAFDPAFITHDTIGGCLASFSVYNRPLEGAASVAAWRPPHPSPADLVWTDVPERKRFDRGINSILESISAGEVYQVNYTMPSFGRFDGDPLALFAALRSVQPDCYAAWIAPTTGSDEAIVSVSPELFFHWQDGQVLAHPMKGTAPRHADPREDARIRQALVDSDKERAENLMIVDLLRNDLSRISRPFGVEVRRLFHTEAWPTVWQMSSEIAALARTGTGLVDVFRALFPCGSISGAPKAQAMKVIRRLEARARGVYCGAVGIVRPGGIATFNVPIRTATLSPGSRDWTLRYDVGSGVTSGSTRQGEWDEWGHKSLLIRRALATLAAANNTIHPREERDESRTVG